MMAPISRPSKQKDNGSRRLVSRWREIENFLPATCLEPQVRDLPQTISVLCGGIPPRCARSGHVAGGKWALWAIFHQRLVMFSVFATLLLFSSTLVAATLRLRVIATSDIHSHLMNYDYYQDTTVSEYGFVRTAALIEREREGYANTLLIDNGDLLQGSPIVDAYRATPAGKAHVVHPAISALNVLHYDVANLGNHELNYGLDELKSAIKDANFPYVNANLLTPDGKNVFHPYIILSRRFSTDNGFAKTLKIGVIGLLPPQVMQWDRAHLEGKFVAKDMVETASSYVAEMRRKGADIVILAAHSGIGTTEDPAPAENAGLALAQIAGVDAIIGGHTHENFPDATAQVDPVTQPGVDPRTGLIGKVPMVIPGSFGDHIGVIDLTLESVGKHWQVVTSQARLYALPTADASASLKPNASVLKAIRASHEATLAYLSTPIGYLATPLHSFFALLRDDPSVELVTKAQLWRAQKELTDSPLSSLPLLTAAAPFRSGGKSGSNYVDISTGPITRRAAASLYTFPNTLQVVKVTGAALREWLEMSAGLYNTIDPTVNVPQPLINPQFPSYNFDVIEGVKYAIDPRQKPRYDKGGKLINPDSHRITELTYQDHPIQDLASFLVVTNSYRAGGGGHFPGLDGSNIVLSFKEEVPAILVDYLVAQKTIEPKADGNWRLAAFTPKAAITFDSSTKSQPFAKETSYLNHPVDGPGGFTTYEVSVSSH